MDLSDTNSGSREQLTADLRKVIADAEALLKASVGETGDVYSRARQKFEATLSAAKDAVAGAERAVVERTREAARATDDYVHDHPWQSIGIGAAVGLLIGILIGRR